MIIVIFGVGAEVVWQKLGDNEELERAYMQQNKKGNIYGEKQLDRQKSKFSFDCFHLLNKMGGKSKS